MQKIYSILVMACMVLANQAGAKNPKHSATLTRKSNFTTLLPDNQRGGGVVCDTLQNFSSTDSIIVYEDQDGGYVSGQNSYGDIAKAEIFTGVTPNSNVGTVIMLFGAANAANATDTFNINVWDGSSGQPGSILASASYTYQDAENDVAAQNLSIINFSTPATVQSTFFAGITFDYVAGDTIALASTIDLSVSPATAWELFADGTTWAPFDDPNSWGLAVAHVVLPVVCGTSSVQNIDYDSKFAVYPTIASEKINLLIAPAAEKVSIQISTISGITVLTTTLSTSREHSHSIDLSNLGNGTYFIQMVTGNVTSTKKFIVQR